MPYLHTIIISFIIFFMLTHFYLNKRNIFLKRTSWIENGFTFHKWKETVNTRGRKDNTILAKYCCPQALSIRTFFSLLKTAKCQERCHRNTCNKQRPLSGCYQDWNRKKKEITLTMWFNPMSQSTWNHFWNHPRLWLCTHLAFWEA